MYMYMYIMMLTDHLMGAASLKNCATDEQNTGSVLPRPLRRLKISALILKLKILFQ